MADKGIKIYTAQSTTVSKSAPLRKAALYFG